MGLTEVAGVRVQILGPVRAWRDGAELELGGPRQRAFLALLAVAGGRPVGRDELAAGLWGGRPPPSATNIIFTYVKNLRRLLEPERPRRGASAVLPGVGEGYALVLPGDAVDLARFRRLAAEAMVAQRSGDRSRIARLLDEALGLWDGPPVAGLPLLAGHPRVVALADERWAAVGRWGEAMIALGAAAEALPRLREAAEAKPMDESAQARLIRAYHGAGRQREGFETYHAARRRLVDELGVNPGPELAAAHAALVAPGRALAEPGEPRAGASIPAELPMDLATFVGRVDQLRRLDKQLTGAAPAVVCVSGPAGVGKTALATHWSHRVAERFPDGQLFVNLRGFDGSASVVEPADALRGFLEAMDVPPARIPAGVERRVDMFRGLVAGRRMLVIVDNARDEEQVRPLLPGCAGTLVLVTSRNRLAGLVATDGAEPIALDLLPADEARQLLERRLGADRTAAEPAAVGEIVARCAGMPLALAVVAARAAVNPEFPLAAIAAELRAGLDGFASDDGATDVRAVFSSSYRALSGPGRRLFRLLGLHPGPDLTAPAAASLAGLAPELVRPLLAELVGNHLLTEHRPGRYAPHDLLRAYAADLVAEEPADGAAQLRMIDHYLHTGRAAALLFDPFRAPVEPDPPAPGVAAEPLADHGAAGAWFTAEHAVLINLVRWADARGHDRRTYQLAWAVSVFLQWRGHPQDFLDSQLVALGAVRRLGDAVLEARVLRVLGGTLTQMGRHDEALAYLEAARDVLGRVDDPYGRGQTELALGRLWTHRGDHRRALAHHERALAHFRAVGSRAWESRSLNAVGWSCAELGDHRRAAAACRRALSIQEHLGDRHSLGMTWDSLGYVHHRQGEHRRALDCYTRALALHREVGDVRNAADTLNNLGDSRAALGDRRGAEAAWRRALAVYEDLGDPDADGVRSKLGGANPTPG